MTAHPPLSIEHVHIGGLRPDRTIIGGHHRLLAARRLGMETVPVIAPMTDRDLEAAWAAVHEATPEGWYVGQPMEHSERNEWSMFAFDPSETPAVGKRSREWTAVGPPELRCVQSTAYCLGGLRVGRWPK